MKFPANLICKLSDGDIRKKHISSHDRFPYSYLIEKYSNSLFLLNRIVRLILFKSKIGNIAVKNAVVCYSRQPL